MSIYIPEKIQVGFQNRTDTYTKKLGYVVYWDDLGVLRKETSWNSWRDKNIPPETFQNEPISGFVLNRDAGGGRGWNGRNTWVRVWDPRNFELEISVENLLYIMSWCDCHKGKGIDGELVYGWDGPNHILIPVESNNYREARKFDSVKPQKVSLKSLVVGEQYVLRCENFRGTYIGRHKCRPGGYGMDLTGSLKEPNHIFTNGKEIRLVKSGSSIVGSTQQPDPDLQSKIDFFEGSPWRSLPVSISTKKGWCNGFYEENGKIYSLENYPYWSSDLSKRGKYFIRGEVVLVNGLMKEMSTTLQKDINRYEEGIRLYATFQNGESYEVSGLNYIGGIER